MHIIRPIPYSMICWNSSGTHRFISGVVSALIPTRLAFVLCWDTIQAGLSQVFFKRERVTCRSSGRTLANASVDMKLVSPDQRGTRWKWT